MTLDRPVAVKELSPELAADPGRRAACLAAARSAAALRHPNIAELFEVVDLPPGLHLVSEWVPGQSLAELLRQRGRLSLDAAKAVLAPVCDALAFAHGRGVLHRGVRPAKVLVAGDGTVKLADFAGTGRAEPGAQDPDPGSATPASDVYGLGVCLHLMLTGELPFGAGGWTPAAALRPVGERAPGIPTAVDRLLARSLAPVRAARLSDSLAFKAALLAL